MIPECGVVLVVSDEHGCEAAFGFFKFPAQACPANEDAFASL